MKYLHEVLNRAYISFRIAVDVKLNDLWLLEISDSGHSRVIRVKYNLIT